MEENPGIPCFGVGGEPTCTTGGGASVTGLESDGEFNCRSGGAGLILRAGDRESDMLNVL